MSHAVPNDTPDAARAARALLAFWRAAGVDMDEAEAVYAAQPAPSPAAPASSRPLPPARAKASAAPRLSPAQGAVDAAKALAASADSVAALRAAVESFDGCALKTTARTTAFIDGAENAPVLLIGEAPGKDEDEQGKPFVGRNGLLLNRMLRSIGLDRRENVLVTNTIYWRPPGDRTPTQGELAACLPFAERLVALVKPKLLICCGALPIQTMLRRDETVARLRNRKLAYNREGLELPVNAMVMLHPLNLMRRPQDKRQAWSDLLMLETWLEELSVGRAERS